MSVVARPQARDIAEAAPELRKAGDHEAYRQLREAMLQGPIAAGRILPELLLSNPDKGLEGKVRPYYYQEPVIGNMLFQTWDIQDYLYPTGMGKGSPLDTEVPTPSGLRRWGDLMPGDRVFGSDGRETTVQAVFDRGVLPTYRVGLSDGSSLEVDADHLWVVADQKSRKGKCRRTLSTAALMQEGLTFKEGGKTIRRFRVPIIEAAQYPDADLPIHPYTVGSLIANGGLTHGVQLTTPDREVVQRIATTERIRMVQLADAGKHCERYYISGILPAVRALGMAVRSSQKRIPRLYLQAAAWQRIALLQGLLDGDGQSRQGGRRSVIYHTVSKGLEGDVRELVASLGGTATTQTVRPKGKLVEHRIHILLPPGVPAFHSSRRAQAEAPRRTFLPKRSIVSIERVEGKAIRCIRVTAGDSLYAVTRDYIVTHNTHGVSMAEALRMFFQTEKAAVIANTDDQTKYIRDTVHDFYLYGHPILRNSLVDSAKDRVVIKRPNGDVSELVCRTANLNNMGDSLLGLQGLTTILLDERSILPDKIFTEKVDRITAPQGIRRLMVGITTTQNANHTYDWCEAWNLPKKEQCDPTKYHLTGIGGAVSKATWRDGVKVGRFSQEFIDRRHKQMGEEEFGWWYECEFPSKGGTQLIPPDLWRMMTRG